MSNELDSLYLAGPLTDCTDHEMYGWRARVKNELRGLYRIIDPAANYIDGWKLASEIVDVDLRNLKLADIVLANCWKHSVGTPCELVYGKLWGKINLVIPPDYNCINAWHIYHSTKIYPCLGAVIEDLKVLKLNYERIADG
jgi:hypothetical protein